MSDKLQFVDSLSLWERVGVRAKLRTTAGVGLFFYSTGPLPNPLPEGEGIKHFQPLDDN